jgi:hypothetical protein
LTGLCKYQSALDTKNLDEHIDIEAFYNLDSVKRCDKYIPTLLKKRLNIQKTLISGKITPEIEELSRSYSQLCLGESATVYRPVVSAVELTQIRDRLAFLVDSKGQIECHGFLINQYVLTAKHCVSADNTALVRKIRNPETFEATQVEVPTTAADAAATEDFALLRINEYGGLTSFSELDWIDKPRAMGRLVIVQSNIYRRIAVGLTPLADLEDTLTREDNPACRLYGATDDGYLLNPCQTEWGTSGVPYFQRDSRGRIRMVGVHGGASRGLASPDLQACQVSLANYGVRLPVEALLKIMSEAK